jgi:hypothetical protein
LWREADRLAMLESGLDELTLDDSSATCQITTTADTQIKTAIDRTSSTAWLGSAGRLDLCRGVPGIFRGALDV